MIGRRVPLSQVTGAPAVVRRRRAARRVWGCAWAAAGVPVVARVAGWVSWPWWVLLAPVWGLWAFVLVAAAVLLFAIWWVRGPRVLRAVVDALDAARRR